jgi:prepilin-type N-terminal cleavage/methylation domain-containing protein
MKQTQNRAEQSGFSLIELLVGVAIVTLLCGAVFGLLSSSQQQFQTESQVLGAFQEARLGLDQIVRDVNAAGYPPLNAFAVTPTATKYAVGPIAWKPSYPATACTISGTCTVPTGFDLIVETDVDPQNSNGVEWVRYKLQGTTLSRAQVSKVAGGDPDTTTAAALIPYVQNVVNNSSASQITQFKTYYPAMFPGNAAVPIFQYTCDTSAGPTLCTAAGGSNSSANVREVQVTLIVMSREVDAKTRAPRLVELSGRGRRLNPNQ